MKKTNNVKSFGKFNDKINESMIPDIIQKRFEDYKKDIPKFIQDSDDYYGSYTLRPVALISFDYYYDGMSREEFRKIQRIVMNANTEFRELISFWKLVTLKKEGRKSETYVVYTADINDNKDWLEKNKECGYIKTVNKGRLDWSQKTGQTYREYKGGMPLAINVDKRFHDYWIKYPFTKIDI